MIGPKTVFSLQVWSAIGPLLGILLGAYLARSWQQKQWRLENKKAEYRELLSVLSRNVRCFADAWMAPLPTFSPADQQEMARADAEARSVIQDRIFIAEFVEKESIIGRWMLLVGEKDANRILEYWNSLRQTIVKAANAELK